VQNCNLNKCDGKAQILRPIFNWENNIIMDLEELGCKTVSSVHLAQNWVHIELMCLICSHFV
jgi:hypothetical protein